MPTYGEHREALTAAKRRRDEWAREHPRKRDQKGAGMAEQREPSIAAIEAGSRWWRELPFDHELKHAGGSRIYALGYQEGRGEGYAEAGRELARLRLVVEERDREIERLRKREGSDGG